MRERNNSFYGWKIFLVLVVFILACAATYMMFLTKINSKTEAIVMVQKEYLPKEDIDRFISRIHQEGKFKLLGWGIEETGDKGVYIVSYSVRRLTGDGFKVGDPVGYWFRVEPDRGLCEPVQPENTITPQQAK